MSNKKRDEIIIDQIEKLRNEIDYTTRDYAIDYLVHQFKDGDLFIPPEYQRQFVWKDNDKCRFIESILLGYPIPFMFFSDNDDGRCEIVDGAQRTSTLEEFLNGDLILKDLEKLTELNGCNFKQMPPSEQRKFNKVTLRVVALREGTTVEVRQEIFNRINTSGKPAKPIETRRGTYPGAFMDFMIKCAENPLFRKVCPISNDSKNRYEDIELILRFFAFLNNYKSYRAKDSGERVEKFLDEFMKLHQKSFDVISFENEFNRMLEFVDKYFEYGFRKTKNAKSVPRARFESIAVGTALAFRENKDLVPVIPTKWADIDSDEGKDFKFHTTTHSSNNKKRVEWRIEYVRDMLIEGKSDKNEVNY